MIVRAVIAFVVLVLTGTPLAAVACNAACTHESAHVLADVTSAPPVAHHQHHQVPSEGTLHHGHHSPAGPGASAHHATAEVLAQTSPSAGVRRLVNPRACCGQVSAQQASLTPRRHTAATAASAPDAMRAAPFDRARLVPRATGAGPTPALSPPSPSRALILPLRI